MARLRNQRILSGHPDRPDEVVAGMLAMQGQDYAGSLWAVGLRMKEASAAVVERAIEEGTIIRSWPMRGTLHIVHRDDLRWLLELLAPRIIESQARRSCETGLTESVVDRSQAALRELLSGGRAVPRAQVYQHLEEAGIATGDQRGYQLIWRAALDQVLCVGPREGKQTTFIRLDDRVPASTRLTREEGLSRLGTRYFASRGPATVADLGWWAGLSAADARKAAGLGEGLRRRTVGGVEYWEAAEEREAAAPGAGVVVLPPFDEYLVAYRDRSAALDPSHARRVNPGGGLLDATVVSGGQVIATWKRKIQRGRVEIRVFPFLPLGRETTRAVEAAFDPYARFLGLSPDIEFAPV